MQLTASPVAKNPLGLAFDGARASPASTEWSPAQGFIKTDPCKMHACLPIVGWLGAELRSFHKYLQGKQRCFVNPFKATLKHGRQTILDLKKRAAYLALQRESHELARKSDPREMRLQWTRMLIDDTPHWLATSVAAANVQVWREHKEATVLAMLQNWSQRSSFASS